MNDMKRLKPDPLPAIHPLPEYLAEGARKAVYEDTKAILGVPWMGVVTMAFSHYPAFYETLWSGIRDLCGARAFHEACEALRKFSEKRAEAFDLTGLEPGLRKHGYADRELDDIRGVIEVFAAGNFPYLLIATIARLGLQGETPGEDASAEARPAPTHPQRPVLMERHHGEAQTIAVYDDIQATLGLPFVNTDYRALARWPRYFAAAWADLKPAIVSAEYETHVEAVHHEAVRLVRTLGTGGRLDADRLKAAALADGGEGEVEAVVRLFQWLLPGLVVNVACFQRQLARGR